MLVIFGPRTRLAAALLEHLDDASAAILLVARDSNEAQELRRAPGRRRLWNLEDGEPPHLSGDGEVIVLACGLGLLHPEPPGAAEHLSRLVHDLAGVERLVEACGERPVHAILVSSVLALSMSLALAL